MAFGDRSTAPSAPRRKTRRSSSKKPVSNKPVGVLAPKKTGVFAHTAPKAPDVADRPRAQRKVQRAQDRMPNTTLPVKRLPTLAAPTHKQAAAIVREQQQALKGTSVAEKQSAAAGNADAETRRQIRNAQAANDRLTRDSHVATGVAAVTRDPKAYGLEAKHVAAIHTLAKRGKLPKEIRGAIARIGAAKQAEGSAHAIAAHERAPHGAGAGLEAVAGLKLGKASSILAAETIRAGEKAREHLNAGTGGFEHGSLLNNALKDATHFPYDAVNAGVQTALAAKDAAHGDTRRAKAIAKGTAESFYETLRHPIRSAGEHPLDTALTVAGGVGAVGRTAGAITRGVGAASRHLPEGGGKLGAAVRAAGDTRRPDLVLDPGAKALRVSRSYSKNLLVAAEQKRRDRVDIRKGLGDRKGIHYDGPESSALPFTSSRQKHLRQAVHEFQDFQQNTGRGEREAARRDVQTAAGARVQSRRQGKEARAATVRARLVTALKARGEAHPERMSALELARAAEKHGLSTKTRRRAGEVASQAKANVKQRAGRAVPTKVSAPRRPFSGKARASWYLRPERELLVPASKQLLGDVRSSTSTVRAALRSEADRLDKAFVEHGKDMDLAGRRRNRQRVGAMRALEADLAKGGKAGARAETRLRGLLQRSEEYRRVAHKLSAKHVAAGTLTAEQARAAAFQDYAVSRYADQGVRYDDTRAPTDADAAAYGAAKAGVRGKVGQARAAAQEAQDARVAARGAGVRGQRVAAQRRARGRKPGEAGPARPVLTKAEAKAARRKAVDETLARRAASAEVHVHEERMRAAAASARAEHSKAGLSGEELTAAVRADPEVVKAAATFKAVRKRVGKAAASTRAERRADALWVRQQIAGKKAAAARQAALEARRAMPAKPREFTRGLVVKDGAGERKLTQPEIERRFREEYGPEAAAPAFVSARPDAQGAGAYFVNWLGRSANRKSADTYRKTGRSEALGINAHGEQAAIDALVHSQGVLSAAKNWDRFVGAFGVTIPDSFRADLKRTPWDRAEEYAKSLTEAHNAELPGRGPYVPVRTAPGRYDAERIAAIVKGQGAGEAEHPKGIMSGIVDSMRRAPDDPLDPAMSRVVLVPKHVIDTFGKHQDMSTGEIAKMGQAATNAFRSTVLPLSTKWLFGNVAEATLRLAVAGVTPLDVGLGRRFIRDMIEHDAEWGRALQTRTQGGLLYGTADRMAVHRDRTMFDETPLEGVARGGQTIRHLPVVKEAIDGYMAFAHGVFTFNKWIEQQFQAGVVGKEVRRRVAEDTQSWSKSWQVAVGLGRDAYRDALEGATNTPAQVRFARAIDRTLGKYSRFSPQMRRVTQTMAPFLPWYANAARFVFWTLPVENTVKASVLANVEAVFAKDMQAQADAQPPGDLGANPTTSDGGILPLARFTPFGAFTSLGRDGQVAADSALDPFLPQLSGAIRAIAAGQDAFGRALKTHDGSDPHKAGIAAYSMLEAFVPLAQIARRLREKGSTGFSDSTFWAPHTKPDTSYGRSAAGRIFNPLEPTYLKPKVTAAVKSSARRSTAVGDPRLAAVQALQAQQVVSAADPRMAEVAKLQHAGP